MGLRLTVLGCSGSYAGPGSACSGYLVQTDDATLWVDTGPGTLANLQRHVPLSDLTAVVVTHRHPDHCRDLEGLYVAAKYYGGRGPVAVYAPEGVRETVYYKDEPLRWTTVSDGDTVELGSTTLAFSRTDHPVETMAVRVESGGKALGYSADAGPRWSLSALGPGLDVALCDATILADQEGESIGHMSARQAGASAREAGVRRLVLTHLSPRTDPDRSRAEGEAAFGAPVEVAHEGMVLDL